MQTPTDTENGHDGATPVTIDPSRSIPHDLWIYRLAVGGISASLVAFLLAGAIVGASGHAEQMSKEYWAIGAALVGALVGIIAPSPQQKREDALKRSEGQKGQEDKGAITTSTSTVTKRDRLESVHHRLGSVYQPVLLIVALGVSLWVSSKTHNPDSAAILRTLAAGSAGGLLGLMVPNPHSSKQ